MDNYRCCSVQFTKYVSIPFPISTNTTQEIIHNLTTIPLSVFDTVGINVPGVYTNLVGPIQTDDSGSDFFGCFRKCLYTESIIFTWSFHEAIFQIIFRSLNAKYDRLCQLPYGGVYEYRKGKPA